MHNTLNIFWKFSKDDIPEIFEFLMSQRSPSTRDEVLTHSIVDLSENKVYNLEFPLDFDGRNPERVITSTEAWNEKGNSPRILIGDDLFIAWKDVDWSNELYERIDHIIQPLEGLFDTLQTQCDRMCCGVEAFDFRPQAIESASRELNIALREELPKIIHQVKSIRQNAVRCSSLNQGFEKTVFIELLNHINSTLLNQDFAQ